MAHHSLPLDEIESLLRSAREKTHRPVTNSQDEPLGPGDVQYLRGDSLTPPHLAVANEQLSHWPESSNDPDALLQQAERRLAEAILDSNQGQSIDRSETRVDSLDRSSSIARPTPRQGLTLEDLADVDLDISIELGRAEILIEDVLKLREGSVVSLDKLAGDPVDIVANGRMVARGELLVIDGKFGVRLSEVL